MSFMRQASRFGWRCSPASVGTSSRAPVPCGRTTFSTAIKRGSTASNLNWVPAEHRKDVAQILDIAERAALGWEPQWSVFVTPPIAADALSALHGRADVVAVAWGGYGSAERVRIAMGREEVMTAAVDDPTSLDGGVAALDVRGNFMFDAATHRDFLGALLGTGVSRDRVGDILVLGETGCHALVDAELVEHFEASLTQVRSVPVETRALPLAQLRAPAPRVEEVSSVEASLRLDAVASAGFRMSRAKMTDLIKAGDVRVNWRPAGKASTEVAAGDVVSVAGRGRLEIKEVSTTKKERYAISMVRYV